MLKATCFGEVLWDVFPSKKKIGGAPLNVALRLQSFDIESSIISRVGEDKDGKNAIDYIKNHGLDISTVQIDKLYKTGCVNVTLDSKGSATYVIDYPVAWDKIEISENAIESVRSSDAFIFGSLSCRDEVSKNTLLQLLKYASYKVFDVNLRPPFYSMELLLELMNKADFIKCNDEELVDICESLGHKSISITEQLMFLADYTATKQICVTKGGDGAAILYEGQIFENGGFPVEVRDTVGAGDSFLAALISKLLNKVIPTEALNFACAVGALVASKDGANAILTKSEILQFIGNTPEIK